MDIDNTAPSRREMAYAEVVDLFGVEDRSPSETLFRLSVSRPCFGLNELIGVFRALAEEFRGKNDVNPAVHSCMPCSSRSIGVNGGFLSRGSAMIANKTYFSSDVIFRNLYRIMFLSSEWDSEILFQPDFIDDFCRFVDEMKPGRENCGPGSAPFNRALDLYETLLEFKDKLVIKINGASGM